MTSLRTRHDPTPALRGHVLAAIRAEPAPTRQTLRRRAWLALGLGITVALATFVQLGGIRRYDRPTLLVVGTCAGWSLIASAVAWIGVARGRSMLGRSSAMLVTLIVATPLALLAWKVGVTVPFGPQMLAPWPTRSGFRCLGLSLALAVPLLAAFVAARRRSDPVHPALAGAALGVTAGAAAGTLVDLWCPVGCIPHLLLGHILPLTLLAAPAAWVGRRFLAP
jgi:hypothetical protein